MMSSSELFSLQLRNARADSEDMKASFLDGKARDTLALSSKKGVGSATCPILVQAVPKLLPATTFLFAAVFSSRRAYVTPRISIVVCGVWKTTVVALLSSEREEIWADMAAGVLDRPFPLEIEGRGNVIGASIAAGVSH
jgi:hypothetical protein